MLLDDGLSLLLVPFDEDDKNPSVWYLDHNFHEQMWSMFRKVNGKKIAESTGSSGALIVDIEALMVNG